MNRTHVPLLAVGVAAAVVAVWLLSGPTADPVAPANPAVDGPPAATEPATATVPEASPAVDADATRVAAEAATTQPPIPEDSVWIDVRVVEADTKTPVPGALVRWSTDVTYLRLRELPQSEQAECRADAELLATRFGWQARTDAAGTVRVAATASGARVFASADGRYATGYVGGRGEVPVGGWQLVLEPDRTLRAQVVDADGPLADVEVGILIFDAEGKPKPNAGWIAPQLTTAPDGIAEFRHVQEWMRSWGTRELEGFTWRVALRVPGLDDPGVAVDRRSPPTEPVVLRMPATGKLRARLLHDGRPLVDDVFFQVYRGEENDYDARNTARRVPPDADGFGRFPRVALGGTLMVVASVGAGHVAGQVAAPVANGQEVSLDLDADTIFSLAGVLLGLDGAPLADATLMAQFHSDIQSGSAHVKTDAQGRFFWLLTKGHVDKPRLTRAVLEHRTADGPTMRVAVPPRELTRGVNDLGFLRLSSGQLVVGGRFVVDPPGEHRPWFLVETLADRRGRDGEEVWEQARELTSTVRPDGSFEVRGEPRPARHRLRFPARDHLPVDPIEFRVGADDLVVPIVLGNPLSAKVLVPEGMPPAAVQGLCGVLLPHGEVPDESASDQSPIRDRYTTRPFGSEDDVRLRWRALPSGTYTLQVRSTGIEAPFAEIDDVVVPRPEGGDPRLEAIDLRDAVRLVTLVATTPEGGPPRRRDEVFAFPMPQDEQRGFEGVSVLDGRAVLVLPRSAVELLVVGSSFRPQRVSCGGTELEVRLEPWPTVALTIGDLPPLPAGFELSLTLSSTQPPDTKLRYRTLNTGGPLALFLEPRARGVTVEDGRALVPIGDGVFRLHGTLRSPDKRRSKALRGFAPREIVGGADVAPVTVRVDAEEVKAAVAALQEEGR